MNGTMSIPGSEKEATFYSAKLLSTNQPIHAPRCRKPDSCQVGGAVQSFLGPAPALIYTSVHATVVASLIQD